MITDLNKDIETLVLIKSINNVAERNERYLKHFEKRVADIKTLNNSKKRMNILLAVDKSGSMSSTASSTISAVNEFVQTQRDLKVKANIEVILFDTEVKTLFPLDKLKNFEGLTNTNYIPSGMTSIYDAFGNFITKHRDSGNDTTLILLTDGDDTSSRFYNKQKIAQMLTDVQKELDWEVVFLGANIRNFDSYTQSLGVMRSKSMNFADTGAGRGAAMSFGSTLTANVAYSKGYTSHKLDDTPFVAPLATDAMIITN